MEDKIKWFEEVLAMEPDSKLFFPLAKLYLDNDQADKAIEQLQAGIKKYPEHFQARCLLLELYYNEGHTQEALKEMDKIMSVLDETPAFWSLWADHLEDRGRVVDAIAAGFLSLQNKEKNVYLSDILSEGLKAFKVKKKNDLLQIDSVALQKPQNDIQESADPDVQAKHKEQKQVDVNSVESGLVDEQEQGRQTQSGVFRTKTMAEILAGQKDYAGALEIYNELWSTSAPGQERRALARRIQELEANQDAQIEDGHRAGAENKKDKNRAEKTKLINSMQALVDRLESRIAG